MAKRRASSPLFHDLQCSVCLEIFTEPKMLPCFHTFCVKCLEVISQPNLSRFPCPKCRDVVEVPRGGVKAFQSNFYISAADLERARNGVGCDLHPNIDKNLYCNDCKQILCSKCLEIDHKNHKFNLLSVTLDESKYLIAHDQRDLEEIAREITKQIDLQLREKEAILSKRVALEAAIRERHDLTVALAEASRDKMMASLNATCQTIEAGVNENITKMEIMLKNVGEIQDKIKVNILSATPSSILEAVNFRNTLQGNIEDFQQRSKNETVTRPLLNFVYKDDNFRKRLNEALMAKIESFKMIGETSEVSTKLQFYCGREKNIRVFSFGIYDDHVCASLIEQGPTEIESVRNYDYDGDPWRPFQNNTSAIRTIKCTETHDLNPEYCKEGTISTYDKSNAETIFMLRFYTETNKAEMRQYIIISEDTFQLERHKLFTISLQGPQRALDVDCTAELFVVLEEAREQDKKRRVHLYYVRDTSHNFTTPKVATYEPPSPLCQPSDVCFFTLGGQELLMVADEGTDTIHVVKVEPSGFTFLRYLAAGHPLLIQPSALNTDSEGRLWVACRGGAMLTMTPLRGGRMGGLQKPRKPPSPTSPPQKKRRRRRKKKEEF